VLAALDTLANQEALQRCSVAALQRCSQANRPALQCIACNALQCTATLQRTAAVGQAEQSRAEPFRSKAD
jgi:hypothetical protein